MAGPRVTIRRAFVDQESRGTALGTEADASVKVLAFADDDASGSPQATGFLRGGCLELRQQRLCCFAKNAPQLPTK